MLSFTGGTVFSRFFREPLARLALALACSLVLHLVLLLSFRLPGSARLSPRQQTPFSAVFSARLQAVVAAPPAAALGPPVGAVRRLRARKKPPRLSRVAFRHPVVSHAAPVAALAATVPTLVRATPVATLAPTPPMIATSVARPTRQTPANHGAHGISHPPVLLRPIRPVYPAGAQAEGVEGTVVVELKIDATGVVRQVRVVRAAPPAYFEAAAVAAVRAARFAPARTVSGAASASRLRLTIRFVLNRVR